MTIEYIRHDHLGASYIEALCDDPACHSRVTGSKILFSAHNGYGELAPEVSEEQRAAADAAIAAHNPEHIVREIIGHNDSTIDPETGCSVTVYEYHAPWSTRG